MLKRIPCVVGPNLFVMPSDLPWCIGKMDHLLYLHPAKWTVDAWENLGFSKCKLKSWPAGIDCQQFQVNRRENSSEIMLYIKKRPEFIKERVLNDLMQFNFRINYIEYGNYTEYNFKNTLRNSAFGVWIGTTESQGIALEEALASGLPLVVLENKNVLDNTSINPRFASKELKNVFATSIPHFDSSCGIVINDLNELKDAIDLMIQNYGKFDPSSFIKENLALEKQAEELLRYLSLLPEKSHLITNADRVKCTWLQFLHKLRKNTFRIRKYFFRITGI